MPNEEFEHAIAEKYNDKVNPISTRWLRRAQAVMPGLNSNYASFRLNDQPPAIVFDRSEGLRLFDVDGKDYIDFVCGMGPAIWGNGNKEFFLPMANGLMAFSTRLLSISICP